MKPPKPHKPKPLEIFKGPNFTPKPFNPRSKTVRRAFYTQNVLGNYSTPLHSFV